MKEEKYSLDNADRKSRALSRSSSIEQPQQRPLQSASILEHAHSSSALGTKVVPAISVPGPKAEYTEKEAKEDVATKRGTAELKDDSQSRRANLDVTPKSMGTGLDAPSSTISDPRKAPTLWDNQRGVDYDGLEKEIEVSHNGFAARRISILYDFH